MVVQKSTVLRVYNFASESILKVKVPEKKSKSDPTVNQSKPKFKITVIKYGRIETALSFSTVPNLGGNDP